MKQGNKFNTKKICSRIHMAGLGLILFMAVSCDEEKVGQNPTNNTSPSPVFNVQSQPLPGGAKITYDLPDETDISYVMCEYMFKEEKKIVRSSIYNNYLYIEGLGEIEPCNFTLYLVDHSENRSTPVASSFTPLEPPFQTIYKTLEMEADFGGVVIRWKNEGNVVIGAFLLAMDDKGEWEEKDLVFSTVKEDKRSIRGYAVEERVFGVTLVDQYGNTSDTFKITTVPLYEKELNKKNFKRVGLAGDNNTSHNNRPIEFIWDGDLNQIWHTVPNAGFTPPQTFTIDLGAQAQLSRLMLWNRLDGFTFAQHNVHYFEVWGTNELKEPVGSDYWSTGNWRDDWVLLGDFEEIKPSGLPLNQNNDEDVAATNAGLEFIFESGTGDLRYIRFVVKETWARTAALHIAEIAVFGDDGVRE